MEFFEPPLRITMAPPTQSSFFLMSPPPPPPKDGHFLGVAPLLSKETLSQLNLTCIFCSVQYDLYFLFNVKLLTTHSTDVAATSVNSKNIFYPFAKALLHYFSKSKSQFPIFRLWIFQSVSLLASQLLPRHR